MYTKIEIENIVPHKQYKQFTKIIFLSEWFNDVQDIFKTIDLKA